MLPIRKLFKSGDSEAITLSKKYLQFFEIGDMKVVAVTEELCGDSIILRPILEKKSEAKAARVSNPNAIASEQTISKEASPHV